MCMFEGTLDGATEPTATLSICNGIVSIHCLVNVYSSFCLYEYHFEKYSTDEGYWLGPNYVDANVVQATLSYQLSHIDDNHHCIM